jgi:hypothetical protein
MKMEANEIQSPTLKPFVVLRWIWGELRFQIVNSQSRISV